METPDSPPPLPEAQPEVQPPTMSLAARLLNVFAVPGDVFSEIRAAPSKPANWLVPALITALVGVASVIILFSQPAIQQQVRDQQAKVIERQVKAGKMTQAQADQALAMSERFMGPTMMMIFGGVSAVGASFVRIVWWAFILWLLARWVLQRQVPFGKSMEVAGLAMMISVLGAIVAVLLMVNLGKMGATPSLALVIQDFDATRKSHLFAGAANIFSFWQVAVLALGLAKLVEVPLLRAAVPVFGFWLVQQSLLILSGLGQMAL